VIDTSQLASRARSIARGFAVTAATGTAAGVAAAGYGLWEKNQFVLREETLPILPEGREPFRILHLSDIHFVPRQKAKWEWLRSLAQLKPDLVVNTGDNLSHPKAVDPLLAALAPLMEFPGVFVPGSNDYYAPKLKNPA
jgi:predicted MPP superfamily phosphohydrolase